MDGTTDREGFRALRRREDPTGTAVGFQFPNGFTINLWFLDPVDTGGELGDHHYRLTAECDIAFRIGPRYETVFRCPHPISAVGAVLILRAIALVRPGTPAKAIVAMVEYLVRCDHFDLAARWAPAEKEP